MSKKARKPTKRTTTSPTTSVRARTARPKKIPWKLISVGLIMILLSYTGLAAYKQNWDEIHDLSVIGNGKPTVVQVHDPSCPSCRALKSNTQSALKRLDSDLQYRIASLKTPEGRTLAHRHQVGKITLLIFDGDGELSTVTKALKVSIRLSCYLLRWQQITKKRL